MSSEQIWVKMIRVSEKGILRSMPPLVIWMLYPLHIFRTSNFYSHLKNEEN